MSYSEISCNLKEIIPFNKPKNPAVVLKMCLLLFFNKYSHFIVISKFKLDTFLITRLSCKERKDCGHCHFRTKYTKALKYSKFQLRPSNFELFTVMTESILSKRLCLLLLPLLPVVLVTLSVTSLLNLKLNNEVTHKASLF